MIRAQCSHSSDSNRAPLAVLVSAAAAFAQSGPRQAVANSTGQPPATTLQVYVSDEALLDEIVVSALVVERKRLMIENGDS